MCPDCNEPLVVYEIEGVEIDHCLSCGGTWLDAGELELLTQLAHVEPGRMSDALRHAKPTGKSARRCPRCRRRLQLIQVGAGDPLEIDRCPRRDGLWLDRGETEAVIAAFAAPASTDEQQHETDGAPAAREENVVASFFANLYENKFKEETGEHAGA